jgi:hypothetical protein
MATVLSDCAVNISRQVWYVKYTIANRGLAHATKI